MKFKRLQISDWRQFGSIDIDLHPRLTILTGANGAGKTTLLGILSRHYGWKSAFISTPLSPGIFADKWNKYHSGIKRLDFNELKALFFEMMARYKEEDSAVLMDFLAEVFDTALPGATPGRKSTLIEYFYRWQSMEGDDPADASKLNISEEYEQIGTVEYDDGLSNPIRIPSKVSIAFDLKLDKQQSLDGIHIPSHRPIYTYQPVESISTLQRGREQLYKQYLDMVRSRYYGAHQHRAPNNFIKESLIELSVFGYGNKAVTPNGEYVRLFEGFQAILRKLLPTSLGFEYISVRMPEVVLITRSGDFPLDAVSGGIASIIDIAWQLYMYSPSGSGFVVSYDEPENHLHPELQRSFLPNLLEAFPAIQFVVASHNPFMVSSVPESSVYVLRYDKDHAVVSHRLDTVNRAGTANEILRDVLGLPVTFPLWVETRLDEIMVEFEKSELTAETLARLRSRMSELGMEKYVPETIAKFVTGKNSK